MEQRAARADIPHERVQAKLEDAFKSAVIHMRASGAGGATYIINDTDGRSYEVTVGVRWTKENA